MDYTHCTLCPRRCGVDRTAGERGFCGMGDTLRIARAAVHYGEEPAIAGSFGAGAVFFSGCSLGCVYCQNEEVSHGGLGKDVSPQRLREIFLELIDQGVQCIDLVTPTHFLPSLLPALSPKLPVPVVYNCGGYETVETIKALEGLVDVYLPDMKYSDAALAGRLSRAPDYPEVAMAAIREMVRQTGPFQIEDGILTRGVLVRHLILPGQIDNSLGVLDFLSTFASGEILLSLMCQYTPMPQTKDLGDLSRPITRAEYDAVLSYLWLLNFQDGYTQDFQSVGQQYIPKWDLEGV